MFDYLNDMEFLTQLDKLNLRTQYAKIVLLSFDEQPIREIQGNITTGSLTVNTSSAIRRTINLTMLANETNSNLEDIENEISINKKIRVMIGYKNPLRSYEHYGDIIWFPCGLFILATASISRSTNGWTISISGKDKMCLLDGTAGGTFPASITFHEKYIEEDNGDIRVDYPTIYQIIYEAVNHWGGEAVENIIITDLDEICKLLVKYVGDKPVYFSEHYESMDFNWSDDFPHVRTYGQDVGYKETAFTYPGELVFNAGSTVVDLLNKIVNVLGNYEFFYDIDGRFIFQQIKNYLNSGSPLWELSEKDYTKTYDNAKFLYSLTDLDTTTAINRNPKYDNVKNDFYVWGKRKNNSDIEVDIRYHLAIDTKPDIYYAGMNMYELRDKDTKIIVRYEFLPQNGAYVNGLYDVTQVGRACGEWREELYRRALVAQVTNSVYDNYYDSELLAEWRNLYDTMNDNWFVAKDSNLNYWNPDVYNDPKKINFWIDFIDTGSELGKYSVNQIGRRTKVINDNKITSVYNMEVPDVIFIEGLDNSLITDYDLYGQQYFILSKEYYNLFQTSSTGTSCFDRIREMMYQNLNYNTSISITCLPKYYMEANNIIHIEDRESNLNGNYQITQFTLPLTYNGTMTITATEVLTRV